ncbi:hypothetical protein [Methylobacterium oryzae]|uniref:hypothetical protein n=1 Tax=Methylobacterium oryzae TaxID=334852 RepID=UPI002F3547E1
MSMFPFPLESTKPTSAVSEVPSDPREEARRRIDRDGFDSAFSGLELEMRCQPQGSAHYEFLQSVNVALFDPSLRSEASGR